MLRLRATVRRTGATDAVAQCGAALIGEAIGDGCTRCDADEVDDFLDSIRFRLEVDDDEHLLPLSDGVLILLYLFGFTDEALIEDATGVDCSRCDATVILDYLDGLAN